ncbi:hypothetical protein K470DRAFT_163618 [Piedraia hortae CBS 480.64]|uniref:Uncharacterized protein n=1 Tax=Piedraia hortae CBS 480.64 TaxID=1314780 RepID=A0A6A7C5F0_9PEZI|nr:hypothetical protein K470DRAFT_163618 [Piedraia hortae CBS 480.64]
MPRRLLMARWKSFVELKDVPRRKDLNIRMPHTSLCNLKLSWVYCLPLPHSPPFPSLLLSLLSSFPFSPPFPSLLLSLLSSFPFSPPFPFPLVPLTASPLVRDARPSLGAVHRHTTLFGWYYSTGAIATSAPLTVDCTFHIMVVEPVSIMHQLSHFSVTSTFRAQKSHSKIERVIMSQEYSHRTRRPNKHRLGRRCG